MSESRVHFDNGQRGTIFGALALCAAVSVVVVAAGDFVAWSVGGALVGLAWLLWTR